ncbi:MAG: rod shape-determining protein MreD [Bacillota bacterium]
MSRRAHSWVGMGLLFLVLAAAERAILHRVQVGGVKPDPLLMFTVVYGFLRGVPGGAAVGFGTGLARDILSGRYIGLTALSRGLLGAGAGFLHRGFHGDNTLIPPAAGFAASVLSDVVFLLALGIPGRAEEILRIGQTVILPAAVYNACLAPLFCTFYRMLTRRWQVTTGDSRPHLEVS